MLHFFPTSVTWEGTAERKEPTKQVIRHQLECSALNKAKLMEDSCNMLVLLDRKIYWKTRAFVFLRQYLGGSRYRDV